MFVPSFPTLGGKAVPINELLSDEGTQANTSPGKEARNFLGGGLGKEEKRSLFRKQLEI